MITGRASRWKKLLLWLGTRTGFCTWPWAQPESQFWRGREMRPFAFGMYLILPTIRRSRSSSLGLTSADNRVFLLNDIFLSDIWNSNTLYKQLITNDDRFEHFRLRSRKWASLSGPASSFFIVKYWHFWVKRALLWIVDKNCLEFWAVKGIHTLHRLGTLDLIFLQRKVF